MFKDQLFFALIHDKYVESELPKVQISDEEVEDTYNELKEDNQDLAALEIVKEQLKSIFKDNTSIFLGERVFCAK